MHAALQTRLLVVDDHLLFRKAILAPLRHDERIHVVGTAPDGEMALQMCRDPQFAPDVILVDLNMPRMDGFELLAQLQTCDQPPRCLILTGDVSVDSAFRALTLGARGYLLKDNVTEESIVAAIIAVGEGMYCIDPEIVAVQLKNPAPHRMISAMSQDDAQELNESERDLLRSVGLGHNNKEIALHGNITPKTVSNRLNLLYTKIGVDNRVQAAFFALSRGIVRPEEVI